VRRPLPLLAGLPGLLLVAGLAALVISRPPDHGPVYSVAALRSHLAEDPGRWLGRTLRVRGEAIAVACTTEAGRPVPCAPTAYLADPGPSLAVVPVSLAPAGTDPLLAAARRLPLLGSVLPPPQAVRWGRAAVCRVQLRTLADPFGGSAAYEALLLDAAPGAVGEG
jgi:hypothetical protein